MIQRPLKSPVNMYSTCNMYMQEEQKFLERVGYRGIRRGEEKRERKE